MFKKTNFYFLVMPSFSGTVTIPHCPVRFDDRNFGEWVSHMRVHMRRQRLWDILAGVHSCPPCLTPPAKPKSLATVTNADLAKASAPYDVLLSACQDDLLAYQCWIDEGALACAILVASMDVNLTVMLFLLLLLMRCGSIFRTVMYPLVTLFLSVEDQKRDLHQEDSTVNEFYDALSSIWRQLDSLHPSPCPTCPACQKIRSNSEYFRVYDFLTRLRPEFEMIRAQFVARTRTWLYWRLFLMLPVRRIVYVKLVF